MSNPIDSVEIATDIASTAFENDEYNQDVFEVMEAFHERDAKDRASRSGSSGSAVPSGCELGSEAFPDADTGDSNYESDLHVSLGELNPQKSTHSASLGDVDAPKAKQHLLLNTTQAGGGGANPMAIASRPAEQPSVAASMPIGISGITRLPSARQRHASRPDPAAARFNEDDEVETDDENDVDDPPTAGGAHSSGRPRRHEEMRRNRRKAREEAPATLTEQSQAAAEARAQKMFAQSVRDRAAYYGAGVGERPDSTSYARLCGVQYQLNAQRASSGTGTGSSTGNGDGQ